MQPHIFPSFALPALIACSPLAIHQTRAADIIRDAGGTDDNWSTLDNWSDDADRAPIAAPRGPQIPSSESRM